MSYLTLFRPIIRWINFLPVWSLCAVSVWGNRLRAPTFDRWLCLLLHRAGLMGRTDRAFLLAHLHPGMTIVDIGANQGIYSLFFAGRVQENGRVLAFEPDDMLHAALEKNLTSNRADNVKTYRLALGSASGEMVLYRSLLNSGDNRLSSGSRGDGARQPVHVRVARLDDLLMGERIDFIKMDVQGWEMEAFRGMERLLDEPRNGHLTIYFEFWPQGLLDAGSQPHEPLIFLTRKGFALMRVTNQGTSPIEDIFRFVRETKVGSYVNLLARRLDRHQ